MRWFFFPVPSLRYLYVMRHFRYYIYREVSFLVGFNIPHIWAINWSDFPSVYALYMAIIRVQN